MFDDDKALALVVPRYHGIQMNSHSVPNGLELVQGKVIADVMWAKETQEDDEQIACKR